MSRATVATALRAAQVTYDRTGSIEKANGEAIRTCLAEGMSLRESQSIARWSLQRIRTHYSY